ncbi:PREDICTED: B-cell scaffold protein with ankyrin repeats [Elephantulus edwardii]|uniref:B-cell scaffold protein with ankyrin repeats n=1 Tax=Elephantulus edwardii TaxID=28737 RepID=UPI0003F0E3CA|nr:PREDICTED: B-cell scaffold protein with ankyrin repeats [Elephantulus edwardii]
MGSNNLQSLIMGLYMLKPLALQIPEIERSGKQDYYEEDEHSPTSQNAAFHHESWQACRSGVEGAEAVEEDNENESDKEAAYSPTDAGSESSENQYDDLYVFIPGDDPENNPSESLLSSRPPPPPPRPVATILQPGKSQLTMQGTTLQGQVERNKNWCDLGEKQETRGELKGEALKEDEKAQVEEEDPYTFAEIDDNEYDTILANMSVKKKLGSRSFIINRPPAPTPRPISVPPKEDTQPYIAQVFQQKTARRQSDSDKIHGPSKKQDRVRIESQVFSSLKDCLAAGQEELILLQEKVKSGKISVDEALEKFKHWQMGKSCLEMIQQEKLRQLRDCIIGKRPEEENVYANETSPNENNLCSTPFGNKPPAKLPVEKEIGFHCRKDY